VIEHNGYLLPSVISLQPIRLNSYFSFSLSLVFYVTSAAGIYSGQKQFVSRRAAKLAENKKEIKDSSLSRRLCASARKCFLLLTF
jgi:hypothetical protein